MKNFILKHPRITFLLIALFVIGFAIFQHVGNDIPGWDYRTSSHLHYFSLGAEIYLCTIALMFILWILLGKFFKKK